jgi:hypothetical protein
MKPKLIIIISVLIMFLQVSGTKAQEFKSVSGIVTAFKTIPLNNVKVSSSKSGEIAYTDSTGMFSIKTSDKDILTVTASGFMKKKLKIQKEKLYKIDLIYVNNLSNFNKVVSNGHLSDEVLRQAIISGSSGIQRDYSKYKSIFELVAGEFSNLRVNGTSIINTKRRSMGSQQILFVVNDRIVPDISFLIPDDVKTIEFVDDVGASLYGSKGANGVLKITLK